jgi:hypothetical protein
MLRVKLSVRLALFFKEGELKKVSLDDDSREWSAKLASILIGVSVYLKN